MAEYQIEEELPIVTSSCEDTEELTDSSTDSLVVDQHPEAEESPNLQLETPIVQLTPTQAYLQVFLLFWCVCLGNLPNYTLSSISTSLYGNLGSISGAVARGMFIISCLSAPLFVAILGLKVTYILCFWVTSSLALSYLYPTWPTLMIGNILYGLALGPVFAAPSIYVNIIACSLAKVKNKDVKHYVGLFQGLISNAAVFSGGIIGNITSFAIFLVDGLNNPSNDTSTNSSLPFTHYSNTSVLQGGSCNKEASIQSVSSSAYYTLLVVVLAAKVLGGVGIFFVIGVKERSFSWQRVTSKKTVHLVKAELLHILKTLKAPRYMLGFAIALSTGLQATFFIFVYTKHFASECIGIAYAGLTFVAFALFNGIAGAVTGKAIPYTTRTVWGVGSMVLSTSMCLFILFWKRSDNYFVIFALSAVGGVSHGSWMTLGSAYLGVVGKKDAETVFSLNWSIKAIGLFTGSFLSASNSVVASTTVMLAGLVLAFVCHLLAEFVYGEQLHKKFKTKIINWKTKRKSQGQQDQRRLHTIEENSEQSEDLSCNTDTDTD